MPSSRARSASRSVESGQSANGLSPPQVERLAQEVAPLVRIAGGQQGPAAGGQVRERRRVELVAIEHQAVSVLPTHDVATR